VCVFSGKILNHEILKKKQKKKNLKYSVADAWIFYKKKHLQENEGNFGF